jgi:hypothetical protein
MTPYRKKLIEVALPLAKINEAAAREKVDPPRPSVYSTSLVGAPAACGVSGGALRFPRR